MIEGRKGFEGRRRRDEVLWRYPKTKKEKTVRVEIEKIKLCPVNRREERIRREEEEEYG